jgi:hypothetical protein
MTKYWGPLGWATLHTVAALYPDQPTIAEQDLARQWVHSFADCIACPTCQGHFKKMLERYLAVVTNPFASRREFALFVLRAHNTVNRRLGKRVFSVEESFAEVRRWIPNSETARARRAEYIRYLRVDWGRQTNLAGISALIRVRDLSMTEQQYWGTRTFDWNSVQEIVPATADILTPIVSEQRTVSSVLPTIRIQPQRFQLRTSAPNALFSLISR